MYFHARKQKAIALSSCESELVAAVGGLSEGVFLQNLLERVLLLKPKMVIHMDSSSARAVLSKKGLGRTRHIQAGLLWVQRLPLETGLLIKAIAGKEKPADVGTKALSRNQVVKCLEKIGVRTGEDVRSITNIGFISQKNLRRLIMVLMTQLGESSMTPEGEEKENEKAVISFHVLVFMVLFSMIAVFVCARTWMRLRSEVCLIACHSADVFSSSGELKEVKEVKRYMPGPKASSPASVSGGDEMEKRVEELTKMREEARASREEVAARVAKRKRESEKEEKAPSESSDEEEGKSSPDEQEKQSSKEDEEVESEEEDEGKEMESVRKALQDLEEVEKEVNEISDEREKLNELQKTLTTKQDERLQVIQELRTLTVEYDENCKEVMQLTEEMKKNKVKLEELKKRCDELKSLGTQKSAQMEKAEEEVFEARAAFSAQLKKFMELKEKATVSEASKGTVSLVTGRAELAKQIKRLAADKEELQTSLDEAVKEKEKSKRNEKESEKQVVILMNRVAEDGKKRTEETKKIEAETKRMKKIEENNAILKKKLGEMEKEVKSLKEKKEGVSGDKKSEKKITEIQKKLAEAEKEVEKEKAKYRDLFNAGFTADLSSSGKRKIDEIEEFCVLCHRAGHTVTSCWDNDLCYTKEGQCVVTMDQRNDKKEKLYPKHEDAMDEFYDKEVEVRRSYSKRLEDNKKKYQKKSEESKGKGKKSK